MPDLADLPELKGVSLVKGIGFEVSDPEVSGPDIFGRIVPMEAHEAASLYSEEKAGLLRSIGDKVSSETVSSLSGRMEQSLDDVLYLQTCFGVTGKVRLKQPLGL